MFSWHRHFFRGIPTPRAGSVKSIETGFLNNIILMSFQLRLSLQTSPPNIFCLFPGGESTLRWKPLHFQTGHRAVPPINTNNGRTSVACILLTRVRHVERPKTTGKIEGKRKMFYTVISLRWYLRQWNIGGADWIIFRQSIPVRG